MSIDIYLSVCLPIYVGGGQLNKSISVNRQRLKEEMENSQALILIINIRF